MVSRRRDASSKKSEIAPVALKQGNQMVPVASGFILESVGWVTPPLKTRFIGRNKHAKVVQGVLRVALPAPCPPANLERRPSVQAKVGTKQTVSPPP